MGIDAIAVLKPRKMSLLRGVLEPESDSAEVLDDGTILLSTFVRHAEIERDVDTGREVLTAYGQALVDAHEDPRGILFYPDVCEPRGRTYAEILAQVGDAGVWVPARVLTEEEQEARAQAFASDVNGILEARQAFEQGEAIDPRFAPLFEAAQPPSLDDAKAQLAALFAQPGVMESFAAVLTRGTGVFLLQRRSRAPLQAEPAFIGVNSQRALSDGALVIETDRAGQDAPEMIALALGEKLAEWVSDHADPRGVPCFRSTDLDAIASATSYDDAIARLGDRIEWVRPHSIDDLIAERRQRLRDALDDD